jgi:hypothetical protein
MMAGIAIHLSEREHFNLFLLLDLKENEAMPEAA